jgi:hypothetical protein
MEQDILDRVEDVSGRFAPRRQEWGNVRVARLGFMIGQDREAEDIAESLQSTEFAVRRQAARLGLSFRESRWPKLRTFEIIAAQHGISYEKLIEKFLGIADQYPNVVINLLDDGD